MADDGECEADATASAPANGAASEPDDVDVQAGERVSGGWEDEIAQVQKLIEELTEKLEWRAGGVVLNQP